MIPSKLKNWPIFSLLEPKFISTIRMVFVYGDSGNKALIVTRDEMVYYLGINSINPIKIEDLCYENIETFQCFCKDHVLVFTKINTVYVWDGSVLHSFNSPKLRWLKTACNEDCAIGITVFGDIYSFEKEDPELIGNYDPEPWEMIKMTNHINELKFTDISCGCSHNIGMTKDRKVYSWGDNNVGQLGINNKISQQIPVRVTQLGNVIIEKIVCGYAHNIALTNEGVLYVWGANDSNQLGFSTDKCVSMPMKMVAPLMGKVIDIAASRYSHISVAMATGSRIFVWGSCLNQIIKVPTLTRLRSLHDAFACFASPRSMHEPLLIHNTTNTNLTASFKKIFDDPNTSDLIFKVCGKPIHVHKTVLKLRSSYFRTMFQGKWMENSQRVIEDELFSYETYRAFLKYLYTDEIDVPSSTALDLLLLADMYNEDQMKRLCVRIIKETIAVDEVVFVYKTSIEHNVKELEEFCFHFALKHMTEVVQTPDFIDLDEITMKSFIVKAAKAGAFKT